MIAELLLWLQNQNVWMEPIFQVVVGLAAIKYIIIGGK